MQVPQNPWRSTTRKRDGIDLSDVLVVKDLPFLALRQYASLDRQENTEPV